MRWENTYVSEKALGTAAEVVREGNQTRYRWFKENHIQPCNVEVWADVEGLVRKTSWSGYQGACEEFANGLLSVFRQIRHGLDLDRLKLA